MSSVTCALCAAFQVSQVSSASRPDGIVLAQDQHWLVLRVTEPAWSSYPAYYRLIARRHAVELSDLSAIERHQMWQWIEHIDRVLIEFFRPRKLNWASLGNAVPHVHWHAVVREADDAHFPAPIWASPLRDGQVACARWRERLAGADRALGEIGA